MKGRRWTHAGVSHFLVQSTGFAVVKHMLSSTSMHGETDAATPVSLIDTMSSLTIVHAEVRYDECMCAWHLFHAPQGDAMILFMWQDDIIGVAQLIHACLERVYRPAGPPMGNQASDHS